MARTPLSRRRTPPRDPAIRTGDEPPPPERSPLRALLALAAVIAVILLLPTIRLPSGPQPEEPAPPTTDPEDERPIVELPLPLTAAVGQEITVLEGRLPAELEELALEPDLIPIDLLADGTVLALRGRFHHPVLVDPAGHRPIVEEPVSEILLSPDGRRVAMLDTVGRASVWEEGIGVVPLGEGPYRSLHWSPDSGLLGLQIGDAHQVWDVREGRPLVERPGRILALGPDATAVWRNDLLMVQRLDGLVEHGFPDLAPSLTAGVAGGEFHPNGERLLIPLLGEDGPGLFLLQSRPPVRLSRGEVTRPLFGWSGDGGELIWEDRGRLRRWSTDPDIPGRDLGPLPPDAGRLRLYDDAVSPQGRLLLLRDGSLTERSPLSARPDSRRDVVRLAQIGPHLVVIALEGSEEISIRAVRTGLRGSSLTTVPTADTLEAAQSPEGAWGLAISGGVRVIVGGREYGPIDLGGSPTFLGERLLYTDGRRLLAIDTGRVPLEVGPALGPGELPEIASFLDVGVGLGRLLVLVENRDGTTALLGLDLDPSGGSVSGPATELAWMATAPARLTVSPDGSWAAVQGGPERAVVVGPQGTLWIEGRVLTGSPDGHWILVERSGSLLALSTRGRGEVPLPGEAPEQAAWLDG